MPWKLDEPKNNKTVSSPRHRSSNLKKQPTNYDLQMYIDITIQMDFIKLSAALDKLKVKY